MLPPKRKIKQKIGVILAAGILASFVFSIAYLFFYFNKPLFVSPIPKSTKVLPSAAGKDLENLLRTSRISFVSISKTGDLSYTVNLEGGISVFISSKKDLDFQVSSLQAILKQLTIEGRQVKSIDFRFDKPVIAFK